MKQSYNKLDKKGRFLFWWFIYCGIGFAIMLITISILFSIVFKQQKQIEQQQTTITNLKRENDSNTASILRVVSYLENVGG